MCRWSYQWVFFVILIDQPWRVYLISRFPGVVSVRIPFPFQEILQRLITALVTVIDNGLHFVFRFSLHEVRWRPRVVYALLFRLLIWS
jgi:hypothetical protein